ncbi:37S ribosomal protein S16, mitochondrial [Steccherinum ochraceum]|uniref:37S ribosomal protein S16, mitochondrial n=1 Tax=Steccherinum ochraceum TaxID=92696 RepID=A0A4R0RLY8_9APHY|nr:37S ribosomal protein S16, mitochondrial [Steccherinum ochraceum]
MAVRLRLALSGKRHNRIYHIVAAHHRLRRDGKPIETLGLFDPHLAPGEKTRIIEWSADRIRYWLGVGAQPSPAVSKLLVLGGIQKKTVEVPSTQEIAPQTTPSPPTPPPVKAKAKAKIPTKTPAAPSMTRRERLLDGLARRSL